MARPSGSTRVQMARRPAPASGPSSFRSPAGGRRSSAAASRVRITWCQRDSRSRGSSKSSVCTSAWRMPIRRRASIRLAPSSSRRSAPGSRATIGGCFRNRSPASRSTSAATRARSTSSWNRMFPISTTSSSGIAGSEPSSPEERRGSGSGGSGTSGSGAADSGGFRRVFTVGIGGRGETPRKSSRTGRQRTGNRPGGVDFEAAEVRQRRGPARRDRERRPPDDDAVRRPESPVRRRRLPQPTATRPGHW